MSYEVPDTGRRVIGLLAAIVLFLALAVPAALAAGGNGASFCSNAGAPTGSDTPWVDGGNAGETVSWLARNVGFNSGIVPPPGHTPGPGGMPINAGVCNPNTNPQP